MADVVRLVSFNNSTRFFPSASQITSSLFNSSPFQSSRCNSDKKICFPGVSRFSFLTYGKQSLSFKTRATVAETDQPKWWEKNAGPNMIDIHSTEEFLSALSEAGDRLVIVEFYGTWCASCRALFPKLCRTAEDHPEITFLKVNFDENKPMCKSLNVKVLPYFHFYRGAHGRLESFSCSLAKFQKIKDAIEMHNKPPGNIGPSKALEELTLESVSSPSDKQAG